MHPAINRGDCPPGLRKLSDVVELIETGRSTGEAWYVKATEYATGDVDTVAVRLAADQSIQRKGAGGANRKNRDKGAMDDATLNKSRARARKTVRQRLLQLEADHMITLTYRENVIDVEQAWKDFAKFNRLMRWKYGKRWQYVCVPERQERGAIHFHMAVHGYYHVQTVRKLWRRVVGEGNIDISYKGRSGRNWNAKKMAGYLTKYITKNDTVEFNKKRYSASSNIRPPVVRTGYLAVGLPMGSVLVDIIEGLTRRQPDLSTYFEADGWLPVVCLST